MAEFRIGHRLYRSQTAAKAAIRSVLNRHPIGHTLTGDDDIFMRDVLALHPSYGDKTRGGLSAIRIKTNEVPYQRDQRGFCVIHDDGSYTDFGAYKCFEKPAPPSLPQNYFEELSGAGRFAVRRRTHAIKRAAFDSPPVICAATGVELTWETAHVDHATPWPFCRIVAEWFALQPAPPTLVDHLTYREFTKDDAESFRRFHDDRAILRVIHHIENSRRGPRG